MSFDIFANLVNPRHWFNPEPGAPTPIFLAFAVVGLVVFVLAATIRWRRRLLFAGDGLKIRLAKRGSEIALWLSGISLFLILMRYARVPYLSTPILFYLTVLTALGFIAFGIYYFTQRYPLARAEYEAQRERARYLPTPRRGRSSSPRASRQHAAARRR